MEFVGQPPDREPFKPFLGGDMNGRLQYFLTRPRAPRFSVLQFSDLAYSFHMFLLIARSFVLYYTNDRAVNKNLTTALPRRGQSYPAGAGLFTCGNTNPKSAHQRRR